MTYLNPAAVIATLAALASLWGIYPRVRQPKIWRKK